MKRPSRKTLRNKLDKVCGQVVRARGKCEKCGDNHELQWCHIFSRKYLNTRWDLEATLCLCAKHHRLFTDNPLMFTEWVREYLGEEKYDLIKEKHNQITKYTIEDLQTKFKVLQELKEAL